MHSHARMILVPLGLLVATVVLAGQIAGGCVFNFQDDCPGSLGLGVACAGLTGAGSGSGASTTSSSSSMAGGGGTTGCTDAAECQVPAGPCASLGTATCAKGSCVVTHQAGPSPSQRYGDCAMNWCDDAGTETELPDAGNVYVNSGDPCITYPCLSTPGFPVPSPAPNGTSCQMGMGYCEPDPVTMMQVCAECNVNADCTAIPGYVCSYGTCVPMHCMDGFKDDDETGMDCGGPTCLPCGAGQPCQQATDCQSKICPASSVCPTWSCSDNVQNGYETDIDCGGGCPLLCRTNSKCDTYKDCQSRVCVQSGMGYNICAAPTCTDGVQNGSETGVDCGGDGDGGPICPPCADGG